MEWFEVKDQVEIVSGVPITQGYHNLFGELKLDLGLAHVEPTEYISVRVTLSGWNIPLVRFPLLLTPLFMVII
jgi:hypothetical protein